MKTEHYPSLYRAADKASLKAQSIYIVLMGLDLCFMIVGSLLAIYNFQDEVPKVWIYAISGVVLLSGLILTFIVKNQKFEDVWYKGRALAESVKTLSWRFMIGSENFEKNLSDTIVEETFIKNIKELSNEIEDMNEHLDSKLLSYPVITEKLREIRNKSLDERKLFYLTERIQQQKRWYSEKAEYNKQKKENWFLIIIICQFLAICSCAYLIKFPSSNWNVVGLLTTISAAAIAWMQLKQHQELKQAYTTAVIELNFIEEKSRRVHTENELSEFVMDSENAISREHTLWLAQKRR